MSHLDISLQVGVEAVFDMDSDSDDAGEDDMEYLTRLEDMEKRKVPVASERATELLVEAGVLDPLKQLPNVKCFEFSFALLQGEDVSFEPKTEVLDIVRDLKTAVEGNFVAKCGDA